MEDQRVTYQRVRAACCEESSVEVDLDAHALAITHMIENARQTDHPENQLHRELMEPRV